MKRELKAFNQLIKDKNVYFNKTNDKWQPLILSVVSYNISLLDNKTYVKKVFNRIITAMEIIKEHFNLKDNQTFVLSIVDYNIDGLDETNSDLIERKSIVECNY